MNVGTTLKTIAGIAGGCLMLASVSVAEAADVYTPPAAEPAAAPTPPPTSWSVGFEVSPEWKESPGNEGVWADWYAKASLSYTFSMGLVLGGSFQDTIRPDGEDPGYQVEATLGYKWKVSKSFTLTPAVGVGYAFGRAKIAPDPEEAVPYWLGSLAGALQLFKQRHRNV